VVHVLVRPAVSRGALISLVLAAPAAGAQRLLAGSSTDGDPSNWTMVAMLIIIAAYLWGGAAAGRRAPHAPFVNGACATSAAFIVVQSIGAILRLVAGDGVSVLGMVFNLLLAATFGVVGAGIGTWRGTLNEGDGESAG
jgi:hypothetical protein